MRVSDMSSLKSWQYVLVCTSVGRTLEVFYSV